MAKKKRKIPKLTPEDHARFEATSRLLRERIAHHERLAKLEERQTRSSG